MKKVQKKLALKKETISHLLNPAELQAIAGGAIDSCPRDSTCPGPATLDAGC
jgi:hypothetical protein